MGKDKAKDRDCQDQSPQCQFYLIKKRRLCRFRPKQGHQYCPEHACVLGIHIDRKRIPCPLNPSHNCYEDDLEKHLKKCNVTKLQQEAQKAAYYVKGINKGDEKESGTGSKKVCVKDLTSEDLAVMIDRVHKLFEEHVECIETAVYEHPCVREEFCTSGQDDLSQVFGDQVALRKELLQQASLVGQLEKLGFLKDGNCFVELGAGKGKLSHWIQRASKDCPNNSYLLVDRSSVRYKMDSFHKQGAEESKFERIKIDIEDLCLGQVPDVQPKCKVIAIGKHLCGGATDMGIRCVVNTLGITSLPQEHTNVLSNETHDGIGSEKSSLHDSTTTHKKLKDTSKSSDHQKATSCTLLSTNATNVMSGDNTVSSSVTNIQSEAKQQHPQSSSLSLDTAKDNSCTILEHSAVEDLSQPLVSSTVTDQNLTLSSGNENLPSQSFSEKAIVDKQQKNNFLSDDTKELKEPPAKALKLTEGGNYMQDKLRLPRGIMIALCCHHRCTWDTYIGKDFMMECGISPRDFDVLTRLSSWATCARVKAKAPKQIKKKGKSSFEESKKGKTDDELMMVDKQDSHSNETDFDFEEHDTKDLVGSKESQSLREQLSVPEREEIGRKCKRLIDTGRIRFLRSKGMECFLQEYINEELTPENIVLMAHRPLS